MEQINDNARQPVHPIISTSIFAMSQEIGEFLQNFDTGAEEGDIDPVEAWWVERQEALERAGYMLRPRYRPGWKPSWAGTKKDYLRCEDGQLHWVS